ncbi:MAG: SulP family inorganic anion transporter [Sphingobacteriia bacterium]|nr:SulP family inorganic anion transporter [Sphingobacteriia bacterium]
MAQRQGLRLFTLSGIAELGSWPAFTLAVSISRVLQIGFGRIRAGALASFVPGTVIQGMLSAIGIILILKQFPHLIGYDLEEMGVEEFRLSVHDINEKYAYEFDSEFDSFSLFIHAIRHLHPGRLFIGITSIIGLWLWDYWKHKPFKIPGALVVVIWGTLCAEVFEYFIPHYVLTADHTVQ